MFSPTQHEDKKFLLELIALIEVLVKHGGEPSLDLAKKFGEHYMELEEKIRTYDYTLDDQKYYELIELVYPKL